MSRSHKRIEVLLGSDEKPQCVFDEIYDPYLIHITCRQEQVKNASHGSNGRELEAKATSPFEARLRHVYVGCAGWLQSRRVESLSDRCTVRVMIR